MLHMDKNLSLSRPSRVSVPISQRVHDAFTRLGTASNLSTGRAIAEWLNDTVDAAEYMAQTVERARSAPKLVAQELHAYALGLKDETDSFLRQVREKGRADGAVGGMRQRPLDGLGGTNLYPPLSNTGGKVPKNAKKPR